MRRWQPAFILLLMSVLCLLSAPVKAQDQPPELVFIHSTIDEESLKNANNGNGIGLNVYFTFKDLQNEERPIPSNDIGIKKTEIQVKGGDLVTASRLELAQQTPIKIAIVLDRSGSMGPEKKGGDIDKVKPLAMQAVQQIGESNPQALFTIFTFAGGVTRHPKDTTEFVGWGNASQLIEQEYSINNKDQNTCLLGALSSAIGVLNDEIRDDPSTRRAILLFTDGKSDPPQNSGGTCSHDQPDPNNQNRVSDENIRTAISGALKQIPIHTIGLCRGSNDPKAPEAVRCPPKDIDTITLKRIADITGGFWQLPSNDEQKIKEAFDQIIVGLNSEWVAHATVFPCNTDSGTLYLTVSRGQNTYTDLPVGINVPFDKDKCITAPPPEAKGSITTLPAKSPDGKFYNGQFTIQSPDINTVKTIEIEVFNTKDKIPINPPLEPINFNPADSKSTAIIIPANRLTAGSNYTVRIRAFGKNKVPIPTGREGNVLDEKEFGVEAREIVQAPKISKITPSSVRNTEAGQILSVKIEVEDPSKQIKPGFVTCQVEIQEIPLATGDQDGCDRANWQITITIPKTSKQLTDGQRYTLNAELRLQDQQPIKASQPFDAAFERGPNWIERNGRFVLGSVLALLVCAAIVAAIIYVRQRPETLPDPRQPIGGRDPVTVLRSSRPRPTAKLNDQPYPELPPVIATPNQKSAAAPPPDATMVVDGPALPTPHLRAHVMQSDDHEMERQESIFTAFPIVIGRTEGDLIIKDPKISNPHAKIGLAPDGKSFVLTILKSSNRTFVGTQQLEVGATMPFTDRIVIRLGPKTIVELTPKL